MMHVQTSERALSLLQTSWALLCGEMSAITVLHSLTTTYYPNSMTLNQSASVAPAQPTAAALQAPTAAAAAAAGTAAPGIPPATIMRPTAVAAAASAAAPGIPPAFIG
eukprot:1160854-Pelagomonas_calceolata.AAC.9